MPTNKERIEIAANLRDLALGYENIPAWSVIACGELPPPIDDVMHAVGLGRAVRASEICSRLADLIEPERITGETSDGYHTFNELYDHRAKLFSVIVAAFPDRSWKSKRHNDGTMYDGMFIVGIDTDDGQATYHYDIDPYWEIFKCKETEYAPEWDGHTPSQAINRITKLAESIDHERTCRMTKIGGDRVLAGWWECSECGPVYPPCKDEIAEWALRKCPHCGAKVIQ